MVRYLLLVADESVASKLKQRYHSGVMLRSTSTKDIVGDFEALIVVIDRRYENAYVCRH